MRAPSARFRLITWAKSQNEGKSHVHRPDYPERNDRYDRKRHQHRYGGHSNHPGYDCPDPEDPDQDHPGKDPAEPDQAPHAAAPGTSPALGPSVTPVLGQSRWTGARSKGLAGAFQATGLCRENGNELAEELCRLRLEETRPSWTPEGSAIFVATDVRFLNHLRRQIKAGWNAPGETPRALIHLFPDDANIEETAAMFRTVASELGIRYLHFDFTGGLTPEHRAQLERRGPRLVVMSSIDGLTPDIAARIEGIVRENARTLPVCLCFVPAEKLPALQDAGRVISEHRMQQERYAELQASITPEQMLIRA